MLCKGCTATKCVDCPSQREPARVACPHCEEKGCDDCGNRGYIQLTSCPQRATGDAHAVIEAASLYEKGLPLVTGGQLDQPSWFLHACRFLWGEQARLKRILGIH